MLQALGFLAFLLGIVLVIGLVWLLCGILNLIVLAGLNKALGKEWLMKLGLIEPRFHYNNWSVEEYAFLGPIGLLRIAFCLTVVAVCVLWGSYIEDFLFSRFDRLLSFLGLDNLKS